MKWTIISSKDIFSLYFWPKSAKQIQKVHQKSTDTTEHQMEELTKVINVGSDTFGNPIFHEGLQN